MAGLGYERYAAQGGDWGSFVTLQLAVADAEHCAGIHLNFLPTIPMTEDHTPEEEQFLAESKKYYDDDSGYYKEQSTKPQTIGYALDDSPVGLAAWIVEKFRTWSDCDGDVERSFTKDQLLDNLMLYWVTSTAHSSARMYYEFGAGLTAGTLDLFSKMTIPVGYARYPKEIMRTSRRWAEAQYDVNHFADMPKGGHFAAFEVPDLYLEDIRAWGRKVR
jgi:pimeloyl-ACP methyl ester carboxylesterase